MQRFGLVVIEHCFVFVAALVRKCENRFVCNLLLALVAGSSLNDAWGFCVTRRLSLLDGLKLVGLSHVRSVYVIGIGGSQHLRPVLQPFCRQAQRLGPLQFQRGGVALVGLSNAKLDLSTGINDWDWLGALLLTQLQALLIDAELLQVFVQVDRSHTLALQEVIDSELDVNEFYVERARVSCLSLSR